jgi:preprotein translocase subunit SecB
VAVSGARGSGTGGRSGGGGVNEVAEKAAQVTSKVQIRSVRLIETTAQCHVQTSVDVPKPEIDMEFDASAMEPSGGIFKVIARINTAVRAGGSDKKAIEIGVAHELIYSIPEDLNPSNEELAAFAETNAIFNVWPYWREYVQSTCQRMGMPSLLLPVFRLADYRRVRKEAVEKSGKPGQKD